jgi:hypothetical protein
MLERLAVNSGRESVLSRIFPQPVQTRISIKPLIWKWFFWKINIWASSAPLNGTIGLFGQSVDNGLSPIPTDSKNQNKRKSIFRILRGASG